MNQREVEEMDDYVHGEIHPAVREIFDGVFEQPMRQFTEALDVIRENKLELVWREENERHDKIMWYAKPFIQALTGTSFRSIHAEAAKHIEGSTCDLFLNYVREKLANSPLAQEPFEDSCDEIKAMVIRRILRIKEALETKHDDQPKDRSDLEILIRQTDLFDSIHINHALLCCRIAYDCKDPEHSKRTLNELSKDHLLSELAVSYENKNVPKYVIARCGDVLYVSFKAITSHNFGRTEKSYRGEICSGFIETAKKIPLQYFVREIMQDKRIVFSGHSSGGAIASLVFLFLLEKFKIQKKEFLQSHFKCITFGLMPLADNMFKQYVEAIPGARECFCHIVLKNDIVPKLFGCFNHTQLQDKLWKLVESVLTPTLELNERRGNQDSVSALLNFILERGRDMFINFSSGFVIIHHLDIFGNYYILDSSKLTNKYSVYSSEQAAYFLRINESDGLRHIRNQYLVNHQIERYAHEVALIFTDDLPNSTKYKSSCNIANLDDISPQVTDVRFENIGGQIVTKISGRSMWFVYNVSIDGVDADGKNLQVDLLKSTESEVQTGIREPNLSHEEQVSVRVKTHFENSKYLPPANVPAKTTTYMVSRRQQQLAKHSPRAVIELAYLSALLERRQKGCYSQRFNAIKAFFESAVSVVPIESLFHAMANGTPEVASQCCEMFLSSDTLSNSPPSHFLCTVMERALDRLKSERHNNELESYVCNTVQGNCAAMFLDELLSCQDFETIGEFFGSSPTIVNLVKRRRLFNDTANSIYSLLSEYTESSKRQRQHSLCNTDLEVIYPSADVQDGRNSKVKSYKAPITLLTEGRKELNRISDEIIAEHSGPTEESINAKTNSMMLKVLNSLRQEFETCSTLLGAFMEAQVHIPLEKFNGDSYLNKIAKHAKSFGLSVWAVLILPFQYLNQIFGNLSKKIGTFVIEFSNPIRSIYGTLPPLGHQFPEYDEKLEFLVGSMKQSRTCNQKYISYSLERQLKEQCTKRNIFHHTPVTEILQQWQANFEDETLTLVPNEFRPLVARWIKWSLMVNNLRESLASQTAIGVIGLVNSGKSKFVRSMFGKETITGTTDQKRTTVPLIYNLGPDIKGMDVIDFPGVDDRDKSIPELAELLLSLTRIIVFVVDYRRAHTESTKDWLSILARQNVPVLICLTFADKLYAELMGESDDYDVQKVKSGVESQLHTIKEQIGQPESGHHRDFKLTVFAFDNDSKLNTDEGKEKLRKAGLSDELDVGRWIAEKLLDYEQNDVSQNVLKFIREKEKSTLNSNRLTPVPPANGQNGDGSGNGQGSAVVEKTAGEGQQPSTSESIR